LFLGAQAYSQVQETPPSFEDVSQRAIAAMEAGELAKAVELFQQALDLRPYWVEGWWYRATLLYDQDRYAEAQDSFRRLLTLDEMNGPGWALLGLSEYQIKEYDRALESLKIGMQLGLGQNAQMVYVVRYHMALLLNRFEEFEAAISILNKICLTHSENPKIIEAVGIAVLRLPFLPSELPPNLREAVLLAGRGGALWSTNQLDEAEKYYTQLADRYTEMPNVHYAVGVFSLQTNPDAALGEFQRELEISPDHLPARLQIAFEYIKRGEPEEGLPYAEEAASMKPDSFAARNALGRILLATGDAEGAVRELEKGAELAPESPQMHFALARAYTKVGRREDARRAREEFLRLDELVREQEERGTPMVPPRGGTPNQEGPSQPLPASPWSSVGRIPTFENRES
jgi:tetratricopeptide (TPR) repeat protein